MNKQRIHHPSRTMVVGQSQVGKTTFAVQMIKRQLFHQVKRMIVVCPTWHQETFDPIRDYVQPKDVFDEIKPTTFKIILALIENAGKGNLAKGLAPTPTLLLVDDCSGTQTIHGRRMGKFIE